MTSQYNARKFKLIISCQDSQKEIQLTPFECQYEKPYRIGRNTLHQTLVLQKKDWSYISRDHLEIKYNPNDNRFWLIDNSSHGTIIEQTSYGPVKQRRFHRQSRPVLGTMRIRLRGNDDTSADDIIIQFIDNRLKDTIPTASPTNWESLLEFLSNYQTAHLTGMPGIGKSWLANQLTDQGLWSHQLKLELGNVLAVKVDGADIYRDEVGLWRDLGKQMLKALHDAVIDRGSLYYDVEGQIDSYRKQMNDFFIQNVRDIIEPLSKSLDAVIEQTDLRPIFIFDEFDEIYKHLKKEMLFKLHSLHQGKYNEKISFVLITRAPLSELRPGSPANGKVDFNQWLKRSEILLTCLKQDECKKTLAQLAPKLPQNQIAKMKCADLLHQFSGGHPGLFKELHQWLSTSGMIDQPDTWVEQLNRVDYVTKISISAKQIWDSLKYKERCALAKYEKGQQIEPSMMRTLRNLSIIGLNGEFFSPIFKAYVRHWGAQQISLQANGVQRVIYSPCK